MKTAELYFNTDIVKDQIKTLYRDISLLRENIELLEEKKEDSEAFEKLIKLGEKIKEKTGKTSTKAIINDIRG